MDVKKWYAKEDGKFVIEVNISTFEQLYDKRDPNPYRRKDLDDDVVEYLISCFFELGSKNLGKIRIYHQDDLNQEDEKDIIDAIHEYFNYRTYLTQFKIKETLKTGLISFLIGLFFLSLTIAASKYLNFNDSILNSFSKELLVLIGWVSMWKPINIFLYEWWPFMRNKKMFEIFSVIPIQVERKLLEE